MSRLPDFCYECGDEFHYDDMGGYNPPCDCGHGLCRSCCEAEKQSMMPDDDWYPEDGSDPDPVYPDDRPEPTP